jgi:Zinc knuckle/Retrotransposon gag protein
LPRNSNPEIPMIPNPESSARYRAVNDSLGRDMGINSTQRTFQSYRSNSLPMHKWKISFDGKGDGEVISFIKDVENMAKSQGTSLDELRRGVFTLLTGKAHDWYRIYGNSCGGWVDFVEKIKEVYLPGDFDHRVEDEIRQTRQRENETFQDFWVRIELVFMKLSYVMFEERKLDHLKHNMHHSYKTADVIKIKTIAELCDACRYVDGVSERCRAVATSSQTDKPLNIKPKPKIFAMGTTSHETGEQEIPSSAASLCQDRETFDEIQELQAATRQYRLDKERQRSSNNFASVKCYNCNEMGHFANACPKPSRRATCSGCGARGFVRQNCRNCNGQQVLPGNEQ